MARKTDHRGGLEAEDSGGFFSAFLADEDGVDHRRTLWRVASWGVLSVAALVVAVAANQTSLGWRRDQAMTADLVQQANRLQAVARESQNEARRLASAVETLNNDRDRLYTRVTVLEQGLDSVTGAIARQNAASAVPATPATPPVETPPAAPAAAAAAPPAAPAPSTPAVAPVASKPAAQPEKTKSAAQAEKTQPEKTQSEKAQSEKALSEKALSEKMASEKISAAASAEPPPPVITSAIKEVPTKPATMSATPLVENKSIMAPPDPAAPKLEPSKSAGNVNIKVDTLPAIVAASPFNESEPEVADLALVQRTEFGVDVGGANTVAGLRALWRGLLKSRANAPLAALQPIIVIREANGGRNMQLRLVAGPLGDAAAAAKLCAAMAENERDCETAVYDGQRLTLKADDAPASPAVPPAAARKKNSSQKRAALEEPKRPDPATSPKWAGFFGRRN